MATTTKALNKENEELCQEIGELQKKIDKIAEDISQRSEKSEGINFGDQAVSTIEKDKSVEFLSHKYELVSFKTNTRNPWVLGSFIFHLF